MSSSLWSNKGVMLFQISGTPVSYGLGQSTCSNYVMKDGFNLTGLEDSVGLLVLLAEFPYAT